MQILQDGKRSRLITLAAETISKTVRRWTGIELRVSWQSTPSTALPEGPSIVLTTLGSLRKSGLSLGEDRRAAERLHSLDEQGFILMPQSGNPARLLVVGRGERGVYNGARYLREFLIDGDPENLRLRGQTTVREPRMLGRPVYLLTIWGNEDEYAPEDYRKVFESFVRDGMDRIYFWASGHFPSRKFPQSYKVDNGGYDSTEDSRIGTVEDLRKVIRISNSKSEYRKFYTSHDNSVVAGSPDPATRLPPEVAKSKNHTTLGRSEEIILPRRGPVRRPGHNTLSPLTLRLV